MTTPKAAPGWGRPTPLPVAGPSESLSVFWPAETRRLRERCDALGITVNPWNVAIAVAVAVVAVLGLATLTAWATREDDQW